MKYTKGPWIFDGPGSFGTLSIRAVRPDEKTWFVASCTTRRMWYGVGGSLEFESVEAESIANARLIAAAPEMYEALLRTDVALENAYNVVIGALDPTSAVAADMAEVKRLIAKVEGKL